MSSARLRRAEPQGPAALEPVANWTKLSKGDEVVIYANGFPSTSGLVEMRGLDGNVFWIMQKDGLGRSMIHKTDRLRVYRKRSSTSRRNRSYGRDQSLSTPGKGCI
jgi:hypothetical protein